MKGADDAPGLTLLKQRPLPRGKHVEGGALEALSSAFSYGHPIPSLPF